METILYKSKNLSFVEGAISLTDAYGVSHIVTELPMCDYEEFYKHWHLAMSRADGAQTFSQSWVLNKAFREHMTLCLKKLGIDKPEHLTPQQLRELVLQTEQEGLALPGLAFRLHQDVPGKVEGIAPQKSQVIPNSQGFSLLGGLRQVFSKAHNWLRSGLLGT